MSIINCKNCGKIFNYDGFKICPTCRKEEDELFKKVKEYLYKHPGSSAQAVSEATEISIDKILSYLKQGKIEISGDNMILECEICGVAIASGRYCDKCNANLQKSLQGASHSMKPKEEAAPVNDRKTSKGTMFTADRRK